MSHPLTVRVPAACSSRDGIWLLTLQLEAMLEGLGASARLLAGDEAREARRIADEKRDYHWRLRAILDGLDARDLRLHGQRAALLAVCGLDDLLDPAPALPGLFAGRRSLLARIERLTRLEKRFHGCAEELRRRFPEDRYRDEFRVGAQLADAHLERWQTLHGGLS